MQLDVSSGSHISRRTIAPAGLVHACTWEWTGYRRRSAPVARHPGAGDQKRDVALSLVAQADRQCRHLSDACSAVIQTTFWRAEAEHAVLGLAGRDPDQRLQPQMIADIVRLRHFLAGTHPPRRCALRLERRYHIFLVGRSPPV